MPDYRLPAVPDHAAIGDYGLKAPVGAGQNALLGGHQGRELDSMRCCRWLVPAESGENAAEQGQGCAGTESLSRLRRDRLVFCH